MGKYKRSEATLTRGRRRRKKWMIDKRKKTKEKDDIKEEVEDERGRKKKGRYEKALGRKGKANRNGSFTDGMMK